MTQALSEPNAPDGGPRSLPRNVWVLTLVSFLTDVSPEMVVKMKIRGTGPYAAA